MSAIHAAFETVRSADGTTIAYERFGAGPALILASGAFCDRATPASGTALARRLADRFTTIAYDRRGRGDSNDLGAEPSLAREVEDIAALIAAIGQPVSLFGMSSGGALVLEAVLAGLPVDKVAVYEVPYAVTAGREQQSRDYFSELSKTLAENRRADAARLFMRTAGVPEDMIAGMEHSPYWSGMQAIAPTLMHDALAMHFSTGGRIPEALARLSNRTLVAVGSDSPPMLTEPGRALADLLPNATFELLPEQTHNVSVDAIKSVLRRFLLA